MNPLTMIGANLAAGSTTGPLQTLLHNAANGQFDRTPFESDPWWVTVIKVVFIIVFLLINVIMALWVERRGLGRMQTRPGPNVHGPFGLLQAVADAVKLLIKEDFWKGNVDRFMYFLAPTVAATAAFMVYAVIPFGGELHIGSFTTRMQLTDTPVAVLYILAVAALGVYGIILAGWSANSTLPLLGAVRSSAQVISYELSMGLSLVSVFIVAGSMSTSQIVDSQANMWWGLLLLPSFIIYYISMVGEVNRLPFDLPECEGELVAGHMTEYSSMKFAWFFLAEYINMFNVSAVATTLFLGGWRVPFGDTLLGGYFHSGLWPLLWFTIKIWIVMFTMIWIRGTLLRFRYDQFMALGWKILIPTAIAWLVLVGLMRGLVLEGVGSGKLMIGIGVIFAIAMIILLVKAKRDDRRIAAAAAAAEAAAAEPFDAFKGGFPVPPMPGQQLPPSPRAGVYSTDVAAHEGGSK